MGSQHLQVKAPPNATEGMLVQINIPDPMPARHGSTPQVPPLTRGTSKTLLSKSELQFCRLKLHPSYSGEMSADADDELIDNFSTLSLFSYDFELEKKIVSEAAIQESSTSGESSKPATDSQSNSNSQNMAAFNASDSDDSLDSLKLKLRRNASDLVGYRLDVEGKGRGLVLKAQSNLGRSTKHLIRFDDSGAKESVLLSKANSSGGTPDTKGVQFTLCNAAPVGGHELCKQLVELRQMGFEQDESQVLDLLKQNNGQIQPVIEKLVG